MLRCKNLLKSCLLAIKTIIISQDKEITAAWKYGMPFFCYKGKMFCYLWIHKKYLQPYIRIVEGKRIDYPGLIIEKRSTFINPLKYSWSLKQRMFMKAGTECIKENAWKKIRMSM